MFVTGTIPFGPRSLADLYGKKRWPDYREEIKRRIHEKAGGGAPGEQAVATWEFIEEEWKEQTFGHREFVDMTVNLMPHSEVRNAPAELGDLTPILDPRFH
jgi:hypothetical protein